MFMDFNSNYIIDDEILRYTVVTYCEVYLYALENDCLDLLETMKRKIRSLQNYLKDRNMINYRDFWENVFCEFSELINTYDHQGDFLPGDNLMNLMGIIKSEINYED